MASIDGQQSLVEALKALKVSQCSFGVKLRDVVRIWLGAAMFFAQHGLTQQCLDQVQLARLTAKNIKQPALLEVRCDDEIGSQEIHSPRVWRRRTCSLLPT